MILTAILWFENNYMKLNQSKCHFLTSGSTEHLWVKVGNEMIWESQSQFGTIQNSATTEFCNFFKSKVAEFRNGCRILQP